MSQSGHHSRSHIKESSVHSRRKDKKNSGEMNHIDMMLDDIKKGTKKTKRSPTRKFIDVQPADLKQAARSNLKEPGRSSIKKKKTMTR